MNNILMNIEMTKAIIDGRKTQTRRVIKDRFVYSSIHVSISTLGDKIALHDSNGNNYYANEKPKYQKDEVIWVKEPAIVVSDIYHDVVEMEYTADGKRQNFDISRLKTDTGKKNVSNYPEWLYEKRKIPNGCIKEMARIFLKITDVRVEKNEEDGKYYFIYDFKRVKNEK